jgi:hypothetical protein
MRIAVLGSGIVGQTLSDGLRGLGHHVMRGSRDPSKLAAWAKGAGDRASTGSFAPAAGFGDLVVLAVKGTAAELVVDQCGAALANKVVIDTTNPIADAPPDHGVLRLFTDGVSLIERLQKKVPAAHFVKAFSCVGASVMVKPRLPGGPPTMFICGDHTPAKAQVTALLTDLGWETEDLGTVEAGRAIEPLCITWCVPGFLKNDWVHAFKLLRP